MHMLGNISIAFLKYFENFVFIVSCTTYKRDIACIYEICFNKIRA